jgi:hypothetical protein
MGFQPTNPDDITFVLVPGYTPQTPVDMSQPAPAIPGQTEKPMLLPEYTESLMDWITRTLASSTLEGSQP